ncbi:MAG TPA: DUF5946 family protein [Anaerolineales bacterium]|jgi:hypothetical protein
MTTCPECGASSPHELICSAVFDECLVREFVDPAFGIVHHLTVATYMLQHSSKLSSQGWISMRQLLREFLVERKSPLEVRRQNRDVVDSGRRKWKIRSNDGLAKISRTTWTKTILDVRMTTPEVYCADITAWAKAALKDSEEIDL